jgi:hypothetical protein
MNTHHNKTKVNPLVDWYQRTTGNFVDRMCCVSYSSQVDDGEIPVEYDEEMRAKIVTPQWIQDYEEEEHAKRKGCKEHGGRGHLSLHGENDCTGKCFFSPGISPTGRSDATATTVSMSSVRTSRTSRTLASQSTINTSNCSGGNEIIVDDIVYVRSGSLDEPTTPRTPREIDVPATSKYRYYQSEERRESPPRLHSVPSDVIPNLPYLSLTEGYEC